MNGPARMAIQDKPPAAAIPFARGPRGNPRRRILPAAILLAAALGALGLSACGRQAEDSQTGTAPATVDPAPPAAAPASAADQFAVFCANCHGANGQGTSIFPKLTGLTAETVKSRLADYKAGKQVGPQSAVMMPVASMLSDAETNALAAYIAALK